MIVYPSLVKLGKVTLQLVSVVEQETVSLLTVAPLGEIIALNAMGF